LSFLFHFLNLKYIWYSNWDSSIPSPVTIFVFRNYDDPKIRGIVGERNQIYLYDQNTVTTKVRNGSNGEKNKITMIFISLLDTIYEHQMIKICTHEVSLNVIEKISMQFLFTWFENFQDLDENPKGGPQPQTEG